MKIEHKIDNNARFSAVIYKNKDMIYAKLKPLDTSTEFELKQIHNSMHDRDVNTYTNITCIVNNDTFIGINSSMLSIDMLLGRYIEGTPILHFYINNKKTLRVKLEGFLVDHIDLKPIEKLRLKINTLYNAKQITDFNSLIDIISNREQLTMPDITIPEIPKTYCPNISIPQSISYSRIEN